MLDAIVVCYVNKKHEFKKYKLIKNVEMRLRLFEDHAKTLPGAQYVNYYWRHLPKDKNYAFRRYLTPKEGRT